MSKSRRMGVGLGLAEYQRAAIEQAITVRSGAQALDKQFAPTGFRATSLARDVPLVSTEIMRAISRFASTTTTLTSCQKDIIRDFEQSVMQADQELGRLHRPDSKPPTITVISAPSDKEILAALERKCEQIIRLCKEKYDDELPVLGEEETDIP